MNNTLDTDIDMKNDKSKFIDEYDDNEDINDYSSMNIEQIKCESTVVVSTNNMRSPPSVTKTNMGVAAITPLPALDERRARREIANSNERRRMQSINAGFQSLRTMIPLNGREKWSKAAILQETIKYIYTLEQEKAQLLSQNCGLKRIIDEQCDLAAEDSPPSPKSVSKKRKLTNDISSITTNDNEFTQIETYEDLKEQLGNEKEYRRILKEKVERLMTSTSTGVDNIVEEENLVPEQITLQIHEANEIPAIKDEQYVVDSPILQNPPIKIHNSVLPNARNPSEIDSLNSISRRTISTPVILPPNVAHTESPILSTTIMGGQQYSTVASLPPPVATHLNTVLVNQPISAAVHSPPSRNIEVVASVSLSSTTASDVELLHTLSSSTSPVHTQNETRTVNTTCASTAIVEAQMTNDSPPPPVHYSHLNTDITAPPTIVTSNEQITHSSRFYVSSTSKQNLTTIFEAIKQLEGDIFETSTVEGNTRKSDDESSCNSMPNSSNSFSNNQEAPLALTKRNSPQSLFNDMGKYLTFHDRSDMGNTIIANSEQQRRPGVIVVKQQI